MSKKRKLYNPLSELGRKKRKLFSKADLSDDSDSSGDTESFDVSDRSGGRGDTRRKPRGERVGILVAETKRMDRQRRELEQQGHRQFTKVHAREHSLEEAANASEGDFQNDILQHPWLDGQRFDGVDPNLNPEPPLNTDARREFDNQKREQEMEKQLRLGLAPGYTAPRPEPRGG